MPVSELIEQRLFDTAKSKITVYPCHINRASSCGHPCERFLFYSRARWNDRILHNVNLQLIFDEGSVHEQSVLARLRESGLDIIEQQRSFEWKELQLTGHIDAKILIDGYAYPAEIKSMSPYTFEKVNSVQDMLNGKYVYLRGYPAQIYMYLLMDNKDKGLFILKNKVNGQIKILDVDLDYEISGGIVKKLERVNAALKANIEPDRIADASICSECGFRHICLPDLKYGEGVAFGTDELVQLLDEKEELETRLSATKADSKRLDEIKDQIKKMTEGQGTIMAGSYFISGSWVDKRAFEVKASKYWKMVITKIIESKAA